MHNKRLIITGKLLASRVFPHDNLVHFTGVRSGEKNILFLCRCELTFILYGYICQFRVSGVCIPSIVSIRYTPAGSSRFRPSFHSPDPCGQWCHCYAGSLCNEYQAGVPAINRQLKWLFVNNLSSRRFHSASPVYTSGIIKFRRLYETMLNHSIAFCMHGNGCWT